MFIKRSQDYVYDEYPYKRMASNNKQSSFTNTLFTLLIVGSFELFFFQQKSIDTTFTEGRTRDETFADVTLDETLELDNIKRHSGTLDSVRYHLNSYLPVALIYSVDWGGGMITIRWQEFSNEHTDQHMHKSTHTCMCSSFLHAHTLHTHTYIYLHTHTFWDVLNLFSVF